MCPVPPKVPPWPVNQWHPPHRPCTVTTLMNQEEHCWALPSKAKSLWKYPPRVWKPTSAHAHSFQLEPLHSALFSASTPSGSRALVGPSLRSAPQCLPATSLCLERCRKETCTRAAPSIFLSPLFPATLWLALPPSIYLLFLFSLPLNTNWSGHHGYSRGRLTQYECSLLLRLVKTSPTAMKTLLSYYLNGQIPLPTDTAREGVTNKDTILTKKNSTVSQYAMQFQLHHRAIDGLPVHHLSD